MLSPTRCSSRAEPDEALLTWHPDVPRVTTTRSACDDELRHVTNADSAPNRAMEGRALHVEGYEGKVVAIDMDTDHVVAFADSPEALIGERASAADRKRDDRSSASRELTVAGRTWLNSRRAAGTSSIWNLNDHDAAAPSFAPSCQFG